MIGRLHHTIIDCPDPAALAEFYSALLGLPVTYRSEDFMVVAASDTTSGLGFQLAPDYRRPTWPDPAVPQQIHLDVMVEDVEEATARVRELGATQLAAGRARRPGRAPVLPDPAAALGAADPGRSQLPAVLTPGWSLTPGRKPLDPRVQLGHIRL